MKTSSRAASDVLSRGVFIESIGGECHMIPETGGPTVAEVRAQLEKGLRDSDRLPQLYEVKLLHGDRELEDGSLDGSTCTS